MCILIFLKMENDILSKLLNTFQKVTNNPESYLSAQEKNAQEIKHLTKSLYGFTKKNDKHKKITEVLNELVIDNFDEEQIWQQIELQNNFICDSLVRELSHLIAKRDRLKFPVKKKDEIIQNEQLNEKSSSEDEIETEKRDLKTKENVSPSKNIKTSIVDDQFFKLHEMENFLEKIEKGHEEIDSDIDYFENNDENESSDDENHPHYNDFFDEPETTFTSKKRKDSEIESDLEFEPKNYKKVKFNMKEKDIEEDDSDDLFDENEVDNDDGDVDELEDDDDDDVDGDGDEVENDDNDDDDDDDDKEIDHDNLKSKKENKMPSTFEARQKRLQSKISALEEEALREKPWQLKGEVTGTSRPQNSLLQEYVEFDIASRPPPVLTEKSTLKLEDIIIQRIKDKAWDDVVKKIKPVEDEIEYKKKLVLDQEKSKLSLAQIYEQEYLQQLESKNENLIDKHEIEPKEYQEIRIMLSKLFSKLDALSNFHFTPKQVEPEIKIISNIPAITMEEVAPTATSDGTLLAPEEIKAKSKRDLIGKSERTLTDKKRERRLKKLKQKLKHKAEENKNKVNIHKENNSTALKNKKLSQNFLQKVIKSGSVTQLEENKDIKSIKSSTFFSKLQDDTKSMIKKKGFEIKSTGVGKKLNSKKAKRR